MLLAVEVLRERTRCTQRAASGNRARRTRTGWWGRGGGLCCEGRVRLSRVHGASAPIQCCEGEISYFANGAALDPTSSGNERFT